MIISVASGKGGTGKTTVAVNLALSLEDVQFLDCDVEEPDAHIFLKPDILEKRTRIFLSPGLMRICVIIAAGAGKSVSIMP